MCDLRARQLVRAGQEGRELKRIKHFGAEQPADFTTARPNLPSPAREFFMKSAPGSFSKPPKAQFLDAVRRSESGSLR
jgi:hypothetical protein